MRKSKLEILKDYFLHTVKWLDDSNNLAKPPKKKDETLRTVIAKFKELQKTSEDLIDKVLDVFLKFCLLKHQIAFF